MHGPGYRAAAASARRSPASVIVAARALRGARRCSAAECCPGAPLLRLAIVTPPRAATGCCSASASSPSSRCFGTSAVGPRRRPDRPGRTSSTSASMLVAVRSAAVALLPVADIRHYAARVAQPLPRCPPAVPAADRYRHGRRRTAAAPAAPDTATRRADAPGPAAAPAPAAAPSRPQPTQPRRSAVPQPRASTRSVPSSTSSATTSARRGRQAGERTRHRGPLRAGRPSSARAAWARSGRRTTSASTAGSR